MPNRATVLLAALSLLTACRPSEHDRTADSGSTGSGAASVQPSALPAADSVSAHPVDWTVELAMQRLKSGGLDATFVGSVPSPLMSVPGARVKVPGAELEIYLYGDANAAAQDIDRLDQLMRTPNGAAIWKKPPALVTSNNMVILIAASDATARDRVRRVLNLSQMKEFKVQPYEP